MKRSIFTLLFSVSALFSAQAITWNEVKQHFNISGYIQTSYNLDVSDSQIANSTFRIRRARLSFAGDIFKLERWGMADYRLQVDFASSPQIVDAWVRYRPFNELGVQLGQFKVPLSIENSEYSPLQLEFIEYSLVVQRLVRMSSNDVTGISSTGRDCGAQLYGGFFKREDFNILSYNLALFNGNGINRADNNHSKDFVGRVMVNPIRDITLAGYYQYGEGNIDANEYVGYQRYGGGVAYEGRHAFARAEFIAGLTGSLHSEGAYASAGWKFHTANAGNGSVGARFDYFDEDVHTSAREFNYTIGATYQPLKYLRLQLNYALKHYPHQNRALTNVLSVMVAGIF
jgi:phosphate-selective porin